ncbi:hypothetical protein [Bacillus sp. SG-1]|uniref:hypothetical protein n=1 Tax=Bacillus sp. SG-1 TaxID=161544 RepID=UPI0001543DE2|nr:hypothetical protein [Bacillus sp. SG-1]EDL66393.1 hypothetical protein BSG1_03535 [Bacillus sp. SG-1]
MRRIKSLIIMALTLLGISVWLLFSDYEWGKYDSLQEAIEKGIPYDVENVIHTHHYDGITVLLYTTLPDKKDFPFADYEALAVAFFKGDDESGWENVGVHGWEHYENDNFTIYDQHLIVDDSEGNNLHKFHVVFGELTNPKIAKVETKASAGSAGLTVFNPAKIVSHKGNRYYLKIGEETIVRGLSENGEVIDRQGG